MSSNKKFKKFLMTIVQNGYARYNGSIYVAGSAVLKAIITPGIDPESYLRNLLGVRILCNKEEKVELVNNFKKYGFNPTDKKFLII